MTEPEWMIARCTSAHYSGSRNVATLMTGDGISYSSGDQMSRARQGDVFAVLIEPRPPFAFGELVEAVPANCPTCSAADQLTAVASAAHVETALSCDATGPHVHDPNRTAHHLTCSRGHAYRMTSFRRCPVPLCAWAAPLPADAPGGRA